VKSRGLSHRDQLGNGSNSANSTPVDVSALVSGVTAIIAESNHTCALLAGGAVKCGEENVRGQIGGGTTVTHYVPQAVSGLGGPATTKKTGRLQ